jgi:hypothetical protein
LPHDLSHQQAEADEESKKDDSVSTSEPLQLKSSATLFAGENIVKETAILSPLMTMYDPVRTSAVTLHGIILPFFRSRRVRKKC